MWALVFPVFSCALAVDNGVLSLGGPARVHELELAWISVDYPMSRTDLAKCRRPNLAGNPAWPEVRFSLESPPGENLIRDRLEIIDPGKELIRHKCGPSKCGIPRSGEAFPLQLLTGPLKAGNYRLKVELTLSPALNVAATDQDDSFTARTLSGAVDFEVIEPTEEQRTRMLSQAHAALQNAKQAVDGGDLLPPTSIDVLAPLILEGSKDSLMAWVQEERLPHRRQLAELFHVSLMRHPDRELAVHASLECLIHGTRVNAFLEHVAIETLYYRATTKDLPALLDVMDTGTDYGRQAAAAMAAHICHTPGIRWSPNPSAVTAQIADLAAFRDQVQQEAARSQGQVSDRAPETLTDGYRQMETRSFELSPSTQPTSGPENE